MFRKNLIVIGGGAAGFFCAVNAARMNPQLQVLILEKTSKLLSKVRISGGGRCNVTHALFDTAEMSRRYPRGQNFVKKTFHQFFTTDTVNWFEERGVKLKAERDGRMFPVTDSSQTIVDCLMREANVYGVEIRMNAEVKELKIGRQRLATEVPSGLIASDVQKEEVFTITLAGGQLLTANYVVLATGGYPKAAMFNWLNNLGHTFSAPVPSLFTFNLPGHPITALMGVSVDARVKINGSKLVQDGPVLITHWGLSGPAVLRLSAWGARELAIANWQFRIHINWLPEYNEQSLKAAFIEFRTIHSVKKVINHNPGNLPARLWQFLLEASGVKEEMRFANLPAKVENTLIKNLVDYMVEVNGKTTFKEEFVTSGGISLSEVDVNTMMSKKVPNLFFAGEVLDVDGITGGFNFQHAWTSGWVAARSITTSVGSLP